MGEGAAAGARDAKGERDETGGETAARDEGGGAERKEPRDESGAVDGETARRPAITAS